jgi:hypothetical protein
MKAVSSSCSYLYSAKIKDCDPCLVAKIMQLLINQAEISTGTSTSSKICHLVFCHGYGSVIDIL